MVDYGVGMYKTLRLRPRILRDTRGDAFLPNCAAAYWNKLPDWTKQKSTVEGLKNRIEEFKRLNPNAVVQYWELSDILFSKIQTDSRDDYYSYLDENPITAAHAQHNLKT